MYMMDNLVKCNWLLPNKLLVLPIINRQDPTDRREQQKTFETIITKIKKKKPYGIMTTLAWSIKLHYKGYFSNKTKQQENKQTNKKQNTNKTKRHKRNGIIQMSQNYLILITNIWIIL